MAIFTITPIQHLCFLAEFDRIAIQADGAECVEFELAHAGEVLFSNSYTPDSAGLVVIYDLGKIMEHYIDEDDFSANKFELRANGVNLVADAEECTVIPCRVAVTAGCTAPAFCRTFFLSSISGIRNTSDARREVVSAYAETPSDAVVRASYFDGSAVTHRNWPLGQISGMAALDVSPARFRDPDKGALFAFDVLCGGRKASYRVFASLPEADPAILFRNSFGTWETFYFTGTNTLQPEITRSTTMADGEFKLYNIVEVPFREVYTGPMSRSMVPLARDLARSREVYIMLSDGSAGERIVITESEIKASNANDSLPDFKFKYRPARLRPEIFIQRPPRIFDSSFNENFN